MPIIVLVDTDGDGLTDSDEINIYGTNPFLADSDDDGLPDGREVTSGTDPLDPDSDDDGAEDGEEVNRLGTNPLVRDPDVDGDGLFDQLDFNPNIANFIFADAGGDYDLAFGSTLFLDATKSVSDWGISEYLWDLDLDGTYDFNTFLPTITLAFEDISDLISSNKNEISLIIIDKQGGRASGASYINYQGIEVSEPEVLFIFLFTFCVLFKFRVRILKIR